MQSRPSRAATSATVPLPRKGSSTMPPAGHPALMQGSTSAGGKVAKCACGKGAVAMVQTSRILRSGRTAAEVAFSKLELARMPDAGSAAFGRGIFPFSLPSRWKAPCAPAPVSHPSGIFMLTRACVLGLAATRTASWSKK